jgi:hypothetical protein
MSIFIRLSFVKVFLEMCCATEQIAEPKGAGVPHAYAYWSDEHSKASIRCQHAVVPITSVDAGNRLRKSRQRCVWFQSQIEGP